MAKTREAMRTSTGCFGCLLLPPATIGASSSMASQPYEPWKQRGRKPMKSRDIDALVAEKVLGWTPYTDQRGQYLHIVWGRPEPVWQGGGQPWERQQDAKPEHWQPIDLANFDPRIHIIDGLPKFSADIAAAWDVVRYLSDRYHWRIVSPFAPGEPWFAGLTPLGTTGWNGRPDIEESGETAPLAIALAALSAVGVEVE